MTTGNFIEGLQSRPMERACSSPSRALAPASVNRASISVTYLGYPQISTPALWAVRASGAPARYAIDEGPGSFEGVPSMKRS